MSTVKDCERARGSAEVRLNTELRKLTKAASVTAPNQRTVRNLVDTVDAAYDSLVDAHVAVVLKMGAELTEARHTEFINVNCPLILGEVDAHGVVVEVPPDLPTLKEDYKLSILRFDARNAQLSAAVAEELTLDQYEQLYDSANNFYEGVMGSFRGLCAQMRAADPTNAETLKRDHDAAFAKYIPAVEQILTTLRSKKPAVLGAGGAAHAAPAPVLHGGGGGGSVVGAGPRAQTIKLKPVDPPSFDGTAKNYSRFKERFYEMVVPHFDEMGQLEFLEKALPEKVKSRLSMVQKKPAQLWTQLEKLFGDAKIVVNEALKELHGLDQKKLGSDFMVRLATTLEDTLILLDLKGHGDYLRHPLEVRAIHQMLPRTEQLEYIRREKGYTGATDFAKLSSFLDERKKEEEEMRRWGMDSKDDLKDDKRKCDYCGMSNHVIADCRKKKAAGGGKDDAAKPEEEKKFTKGCWNSSRIYLKKIFFSVSISFFWFRRNI